VDLENVVGVGAGERFEALALLVDDLAAVLAPKTPHTVHRYGVTALLGSVNGVEGGLLKPGVHDLRDGRKSDLGGSTRDVQIPILRRRIRMGVCPVDREGGVDRRPVLELLNERVLQFDLDCRVGRAWRKDRRASGTGPDRRLPSSAAIRVHA
jgi:hypothetical protein